MPGRQPKALQLVPLLVVSMLVGACTIAATPAAGGPESTATAGASVTTAPSTLETAPVEPGPTESPTEAPTLPGPPPPPKDFKAVSQDGFAPCPSPNVETGGMCQEVDLSWTSTTPGSWFKVYSYWTGEGDVTCVDPNLILQADILLETDPDVTGAKIYNSLATGNGAQCLWLTANTDAGESDPVAAGGQ